MGRKEILEKIQKDVFKGEDTDHTADVDQIYMDLIDLNHPAYMADKDIHQQVQSINSNLRIRIL
jgi:hypothetical protein